MSTFSGIIGEYPNISIDNFCPLVHTYFLSHLHLDHIVGFEMFFSTPDTKIYTSEVTAKLIAGRYSEFKQLISYVKPLELKKAYDIEIKSFTRETEIINVILIPSGHCLGSAMFLISGSKGRVLYTGDFRIPVGCATELATEYDIGHLDGLYLDTTFMNKACTYLPSREESFWTILNIIEDFLLKSPNNKIFIEYRVRYTIEMLYHLIYLRFNIKVHVDWKYYAQLSELDENLSYCMDPENINSRIHACYLGDSLNSENFCKERINSAKLNNNLLTIIPSTIWWSERNLPSKKLVHYVDKFTVRVCFSHHSSYSEIIDLISTIPTKSINNCVCQSEILFDDVKKCFDK